MTRALLTLTLVLTLGSAAGEPSRPEAPESQAPPKVEDLGGGKFRIGLVTVDQATRALSFPATVNMTEGMLEFAIVHEQGKIHESLLVTKVDAFNLNVGLKLLRYQESPELFEILDDDYRSTGKFPQVPATTREAARLDLFVTWQDEDGAPRKEGINEWIWHVPSKAPVPAGPWIYGGSYLHRGVFQAKAQGEIAALFTSRISLFNFPGKNRELDDVWEPTPKTIPPPGTAVTVTLQPSPKTTP